MLETVADGSFPVVVFLLPPEVAASFGEGFFRGFLVAVERGALEGVLNVAV